MEFSHLLSPTPQLCQGSSFSTAWIAGARLNSQDGTLQLISTTSLPIPAISNLNLGKVEKTSGHAGFHRPLRGGKQHRNVAGTLRSLSLHSNQRKTVKVHVCHSERLPNPLWIVGCCERCPLQVCQGTARHHNGKANIELGVPSQTLGANMLA